VKENKDAMLYKEMPFGTFSYSRNSSKLNSEVKSS